MCVNVKRHVELFHCTFYKQILKGLKVIKPEL